MALYEHPASLFVAGFLGSPRMNFLTAIVLNVTQQAALAQLADGSLLQILVDASGVGVGDKIIVGIRAEHLRIGNTLAVDQNQLKVDVNFVEHLGDTCIVYANFPGAENLLAAKFPVTYQQLQAGQKLCLQVAAEHCYAFTQAGTALPRLSPISLN